MLLPLVTVRALWLRQIASNRLACVRAGFGPVHLAAGRHDIGLERFEIEIEMRQRVILDCTAGFPQSLPFRQCRNGTRPAVYEARAHVAERSLERRIAQRRGGAAA